MHAAGSGPTVTRRLLGALLLTLAFLGVEVVAGIWSGSLALLSDAAHMLTDAGALGLALGAAVLARRERTGRKTFGFRRAEILATLVNGTVLAVSSVWVSVEAIARLRSPQPIAGGAMLVVAGAGLLVNLLSAWILSRGGDASSNMNVRAAFAHVLSDAAGSVAALVAGALVLWRGYTIADPLASLAIAALVLFGAFRLVRASVDVLMEGAPAHVDIAALERVIAATPGVADAHDLHVWSISEGFPVVTVHVVLAGGHHGTEVAGAVAQRIEAAIGVAHVTVQPEAPRPSGLLVSADALVRHR